MPVLRSPISSAHFGTSSLLPPDDVEDALRAPVSPGRPSPPTPLLAPAPAPADACSSWKHTSNVQGLSISILTPGGDADDDAPRMERLRPVPPGAGSLTPVAYFSAGGGVDSNRGSTAGGVAGGAASSSGSLWILIPDRAPGGGEARRELDACCVCVAVVGGGGGGANRFIVCVSCRNSGR